MSKLSQYIAKVDDPYMQPVGEKIIMLLDDHMSTKAALQTLACLLSAIRSTHIDGETKVTKAELKQILVDCGAIDD